MKEDTDPSDQSVEVGPLDSLSMYLELVMTLMYESGVGLGVNVVRTINSIILVVERVDMRSFT